MTRKTSKMIFISSSIQNMKALTHVNCINNRENFYTTRLRLHHSLDMIFIKVIPIYQYTIFQCHLQFNYNILS